MKPNENGEQQRNESLKLHLEHIESMQGFYQRTAQRYNTWHCNPSDASCHNYAVREVLKLLAENKNQSLLDVCCGTGRCVRAALDAGYDAQGIDLSPDLLKIAETELKIPKERLHCGDAAKLPFDDQSFDITCVMGALHHSAIPQSIIDEMLRVTRKAVIISDEANHMHRGVKSVLVKLGIFDVVYRIIFRKPRRPGRRLITSDSDGPTFDFSVEEIMPSVQASFAQIKCLTFYRFFGVQICAYWFPRLFARQCVIIAQKKRLQ